jgi:glycosyltransferase involved in cell wall biosynthesis
MRILFLPRYGSQGASSRYRIWQYVPLLERAGHEVEVRPLLDDGYLKELYGTGRRGFGWLISGYARRLRAILGARQFELVVCEQEVLPLLPAMADLFLLAFNNRLVIDYDDAAYFKYEGWPVLRRKIPRLMAAAKAVVVGNSHLARYASQFTTRVFVIPSVVNLANYQDRAGSTAAGTVRIVWIGTPLTASLLKPLLPTMAKLQEKHPDISFRFIGAGKDFPGNGLRSEVFEWCERTEAELIAQCHIGIMPLPDNEFTRAKCGLKLIQYMASGLPVVASPVGANREIVSDNKNGFLVETEQEWFEKLSMLIESPDLRTQMGKAGRARVTERYTLEHGFSKWLEILTSVRQPTSDCGFQTGSPNEFSQSLSVK